jgi:hypothetical protein
MANEPTTVSRRRALLAAGGGVAALVANAVTRPAQALAANGDALTIGVTTNSASSETRLTDTGPGYDGAGLSVVANTRSAALQAECNNENGTAVRANSGSGFGVVAVGNKAGLAAQGSSGPGVLAENFYGGLAVKATSTGPTPGTAIEADGSVGLKATASAIGVKASGGATGIEASGGLGLKATGSTTGIEASGPTGLKATGSSVGVKASGGATGIVASVGPAPTVPTGPIAAYAKASGADPTAIWGQGGTVSSGSSTGVYGEGNTGVWGYGGWGVFGAGDTGVYGFSGAIVPAAPAHTGVFGYSDSGTGVYAKASTGTALQVSGKARFSRSGRAAVAAARSYVDVTVAGGLTGTPLCFATLMTYRSGTAIAAVRPNYPTAGKVRIYLTKSVTATTYVAWFVAN